ncbi:MAG: integrase [Thermoproteota archaeon]
MGTANKLILVSMVETMGSPGFEPRSPAPQAFEEWVRARYREKWANMVIQYVRKYGRLLDGNLSVLESFKKAKRQNVLKALIAYSKYLGRYEEFKHRVKSFGFKWERQDAFESFLRIMNSGNSDFKQWVNKCLTILDDPQRLFLVFILATGMRSNEAIESFNLIVKLSREGRLREYYNPDLQALEHFRYPKLFLRGSKNAFISFISENMVEQIARSKQVSYPTLRKKIRRQGLKTRLNEARDYYATFMAQNGLIREEIDLLQGRVGKAIFMRSYFTPAIKELSERTLKAVRKLLEELENEKQA